MMNNNEYVIIILFLIILSSLFCNTIRMKKIKSDMNSIQKKLNVVCEQEAVTQGVLSSHINNTLSDDRGGE